MVHAYSVDREVKLDQNAQYDEVQTFRTGTANSLMFARGRAREYSSFWRNSGRRPSASPSFGTAMSHALKSDGILVLDQTWSVTGFSGEKPNVDPATAS
jgi:hypothetical protein